MFVSRNVYCVMQSHENHFVDDSASREYNVMCFEHVFSSYFKTEDSLRRRLSVVAGRKQQLQS